jgi:hypothetical protein
VIVESGFLLKTTMAHILPSLLGTEEFKAKAFQVAMTAPMGVTFADAKMEHQRQALFSM